ncbi:hypothetical protein Dtox_2938 [Desulfofarcimen acetoxidans DSM 771]|uniref:Uncharacterized protein n=1 Tax=Desulfofarcimen acetoxidans (strain ATCC 49208 / DSM 771 / KCTC 5769 / VKM B-1644 / 5575) TaxID=485916 RepID=C8W2L0_DESAS|nr:hypothetical protein [Desulfofarcimen acetoxidans]ACV63694.1 hypothetical protein Dtox_2938 [Desulfofarcimen acetoxidans DSM 771]
MSIFEEVRHTGSVGNTGFRGTISFMRLLIMVSIVLVSAGSILMLGLPVPVAGILAGIALAALLVGSKNLFDVANTNCPNCSTEILTINDFGSLQCPNCQQKLRVEGRKAYMSSF